MTAELRSIYSGPIRRALDRLNSQLLKMGSNGTGEGVSLVIDPAYAGPWRSSATGLDKNTAQFGSIKNVGKEGMHVDASGYVRMFARTGTPWTGANQFQWSEVAADHVTETWIASLSKDTYQVGDIAIGLVPTYQMWGVFKSTERAGPDYLVMRGGAGELFLDALAGQYISLRAGNTAMLDVQATKVGAGGMYQSSFNPGNATWDSAQFLAYCTAGTGEQARLALHSPGSCPQLRSVGVNGERFGVVNAPATAWAPIGALAFETNSSLTTKRDVRHLGERERIIVHHPVDADTVPPLDVMSLRPVAFRPKVVSDDTDTGLPRVGVLGHEERRERLGLVAEEVHTVLPSAVSHDCDGNALGIDYAQITVALLDHVQRLTDEVATLRYRITELEAS